MLEKLPDGVKPFVARTRPGRSGNSTGLPEESAAKVDACSGNQRKIPMEPEAPADDAQDGAGEENENEENGEEEEMEEDPPE